MAPTTINGQTNYHNVNPLLSFPVNKSLWAKSIYKFYIFLRTPYRMENLGMVYISTPEISSGIRFEIGTSNSARLWHWKFMARSFVFLISCHFFLSNKQNKKCKLKQPFVTAGGERNGARNLRNFSV